MASGAATCFVLLADGGMARAQRGLVYLALRPRWLPFVFPLQKVDVEKMLVVPTCQHSKLDIVQVGEAVEDEKNRLLENFFVRPLPLHILLRVYKLSSSRN